MAHCISLAACCHTCSFSSWIHSYYEHVIIAFTVSFVPFLWTPVYEPHLTVRSLELRMFIEWDLSCSDGMKSCKKNIWTAHPGSQESFWYIPQSKLTQPTSSLWVKGPKPFLVLWSQNILVVWRFQIATLQFQNSITDICTYLHAVSIHFVHRKLSRCIFNCLC